MNFSCRKNAISILVDHIEYFIDCFGLWKGMDKFFNGRKLRKIIINRLLLITVCFAIDIKEYFLFFFNFVTKDIYIFFSSINLLVLFDIKSFTFYDLLLKLLDDKYIFCFFFFLFLFFLSL